MVGSGGALTLGLGFEPSSLVFVRWARAAPWLPSDAEGPARPQAGEPVPDLPFEADVGRGWLARPSGRSC